VALKKLGYSMNTRNEAELEEAKQELIKQKPLVLAYIVDEIRDKMLSGEGAVAVAWSGDAMDVILSGETFEYIVPKEGSNFWIDAMVVPANAKNPDAAHKFINFMTDPENAAANSEYIGYSTPNEAALELLPDEMINSDVAYPSQEIIDNCEIFRDPGEFISVYNRIWTEVTVH
jgi:spermidine/putrescine transport system substrate-binding protein